MHWIILRSDQPAALPKARLVEISAEIMKRFVQLSVATLSVSQSIAE